MATMGYPPPPVGPSPRYRTIIANTTSPSPPPPYTFHSDPSILVHPQPHPQFHPQFLWYPYPSLMDPVVPFHTSSSSMAQDIDCLSPADGPPSISTSPNSHHSHTPGTENGIPTSTSPSGTVDTRINTPSVQAACLACRGKHLKCDGQTPCSRCKSSASECVYVASRRGYKGPRRGNAQNPNKRQRSSSPKDSPPGTDGPAVVATASSAPTTSCAFTSAFNPSIILPVSGSNSPFPPMPAALSADTNLQLFRPLFGTGGGDSQNLVLNNAHQNGTVPAQVPVPTPAERCLQSFYHHFHAAHPFVLPKEYLLQVAKEGTIEPLLAAMRWIGSFYIDAGPARVTFFDEARRLAYEPHRPKCGFLVQALLLLVIGLDGSAQQDKAREILADVEKMVIQIGLNTRLFATLHGRGMPVLEESWRRTWWDLYVVDAMIAGVHRATNFLLFDITSDVALPCEEHQYLSGEIPQPMYLEDLEDSDFSGDDREFSSFAYRILCARNLGKFMRIPPIFGPDDENLARIEALLTNWRLHLPESKRDALHKDGRLDEMMFQAHMMLHATSILLHQPHSQLDSASTRSVTSCAPHRAVPCGDVFNSHTKHTIQSANEISRLITHRVPILSHTHFFTCVVTLSSIVHLSKWALSFIPHDDDDLRQQIRLNIGALNLLSQVWPSATRTGREVKGVAQEIYRLKKQQQLTPQYWLGLTSEEVMRSMAADDGIISEIESIMPSMPNLLS